MSRSTAVPAESETSRRKPFRLWLEVLIAYAAPALMAFVGGVISGQPELMIAAFTTIAGSSALVALIVGALLQLRAKGGRWPASARRVPLVFGFAIIAAAIGFGIAWVLNGQAPGHWGALDVPWVSRLWFDLPLSSFLATSIVTWHWRSAQKPRARQA